MPKSSPKSRRIDANERNALIRHHLEEASTHLGMVKHLIPEDEDPKGEWFYLTKIGKALKKLYVRHGGHPDA